MDYVFKIELRDFAGVRELVNFDYRHHNRQGLYGEACRYIKDTFRSCLDRISVLLNCDISAFVINLEQGQDSDDGYVLSCFDPEMSKEGEFFFRVYYDSMMQIVDCILKGSEQEMKENFVTIVNHELMHAIDLGSLKSVVKARALDHKSYGMRSSTVFLEAGDVGYAFNVQWTLLDFFSRFRNEGIAIMGERLLANRPYVASMSLEKALEEFREALDITLHLCSGLEYYNRFETHEAYKAIESSSMLAYACSDILFAHILDVNQNEYPEDYGNVIGHILHGRNGELSDSEILRFISGCIDIDLTEYIQRVLTLPKVDCLEKYLCCCSVIQRNTNEEAISEFSRLLVMSAYNRDYDTFNGIIRSAVGMLIPLDEARTLFQQFKLVGCPDSVADDILGKTALLLDRAERCNDTTAHWALTYLFDGYDLTHDDISFLGWQDDWMVVTSAVRICCPPGVS